MTWQEAVTGTAAITLMAAVTIAVVIQVAATWRAKMSVQREEAYRKLAEEATAAQADTARQLERLATELTAVRERTAALESLLKEVEEPWAR